MHADRPNLTIAKLCIAAVCLWPAGAVAMSERVAALCDTAARRAASQTGVPLDILVAVTRAETGRTTNGRFHSWPWTVNMAGRGYWFPTRTAAHEYARDQSEAGLRSFDIGCFQINHRWHAGEFASLDAMFDPMKNARYAAQFLRQLHLETGDWSLAIGAYHSRTPKYAKRYRERISRIRSQLTADDVVSARPILNSLLDETFDSPADGKQRHRLGSTSSLLVSAGARPPINLLPRRPVME